MQIFAFLRLRRNRLITAMIGSLFVVVAALLRTSGDGFIDVGVLWHHFCGCPPRLADTMLLLVTPLGIDIIAGICLGAATASNLSPILKGEALFLLTRPISRFRVLAVPLVFVTVLLLLFPLLAWILLLGWLTLVHAPSLHHLTDLMQLVAPVAAIGAHPSLLQIVRVPQMFTLYVAAVAVGLCAYVLFASQRWLLLAASQRLRLVGSFLPLIFCLLPAINLLFGRGIIHWLLLVPGFSPAFHPPSPEAILVHLLFVAAWFTFTVHTVRRLEL